MKKTLLLSFLFFILHAAKASDTLTLRQVFNFNVGDTLDYSNTLTSINTGSFYGASFQRLVIISKQFSVSNDSVTFGRLQLYPPTNSTDLMTISHLDSTVTSLYAPLQFGFQSDTMYGRLTNKLRDGSIGFSTVVDVDYGEGLGIINQYTGSYFYGCNNTDYTFGPYYHTLVYYADSSYRFGRPYYELNGSQLIHYIPIPEECAYWNYAQSTPNGTDHFQIHTGTKTYLNNHTFVELILRSVVSGVFSSDSLIGYFRNDTSGQRLYYCHIPGAAESLMYDFSATDNGGYNGTFNTGLIVDTITIGGVQRTIWKTTVLEPLGDGCVWKYISGIGTTMGLFHAQACDAFTTCYTLPPSPPMLESFCVCGQMQYPASTSGQCYLLTGINDVGNNQAFTNLYPNPTADFIHLSFTDASKYDARLILTNILGQQVYSSPISDKETTHDISFLPLGIYTWRIASDNTILKTGKLVKQ